MECSSVLQLNNDCLWLIFKYLDFPELVIAGSVCKRFEGISQMFYTNCQSMDLCYLDNMFSKKSLCPRLGRHAVLGEVMRQLEPHMISMKLLDLSYEDTFGRPEFPISIFPNLQHLFLGGYYCKFHEEYANIFPALQKIVLYRLSWTYESILNRWLRNSHQLKILKFIGIVRFTGKCLVKVKGIEELTIYRCHKIQEKFFQQFCQMNPQLKKFSLHWDTEPSGILNTLLEIIGKYLKNLESLVITNGLGGRDVNYEILRDLAKVTKLHVEDACKPSSIFYNLLEHFATNNHIEHLHLKFAPEDVLLNKVQQFPYLKVLKLTNLSLTFEELSNFSCSATLEELYFGTCNLKTVVGLKKFIQQFKSLRLINVQLWNDFPTSLLMKIEECLYNRSQKLEIQVEEAFFGPELCTKINSDLLKEFLDSTKEKLEFTFITKPAKLTTQTISFLDYEWERKEESF